LHKLKLITSNPPKKLFVFQRNGSYVLYQLIEQDGTFKFEKQFEVAVIEDARLWLTPEDQLLQIKHAIKDFDVTIESTRSSKSDGQQKLQEEPITFTFS
jgi:hypothetical protein